MPKTKDLTHDDILGFIARKQFGDIATSFGVLQSLDTPFVFVEWRHILTDAGAETGRIHPTVHADMDKVIRDIEAALNVGDELGTLWPESVFRLSRAGLPCVATWPVNLRGVAVYVLPGSNEGYHVYIEIVHPDHSRSFIATAKFMGRSDAERAALLLSRKFNVL